MATKPQIITELYNKTLRDISKPGNWKSFLQTACRNYKHRFDEQVLIYAQRPDAAVTLEMEKWNEKYKRWVNGGAKGIAVFDDKYSGKTILKHYFDITDTHETQYTRPVPILNIKPEYEANIIETLENSFGKLSDRETFASALMSATKNAVDDNITDYLSQLLDCLNYSMLDGLDDTEVLKITYGLLYNSVSFMLLTRCGLDAGLFIDNESFQDIVNFSTPETINILGAATSDIAEMELREIASTVLALQKSEKNKKSIFAKKDNPEHNKNKTINDERGFNNGRVNIHQTGRLSDSRPYRTGTTGNSPWEIRIKTSGLLEEPQKGSLHQSADIGKIKRTPDGNRADSNRPDGTVHQTDGESSGSNRRIESYRPTEMGRDDEQHPTQRRRDNLDGTDLHLKILPTVEEQIESIEQAEKEKLSAFSVSQEDIDAVLQRRSSIEYGKYRIHFHFQELHSEKETIDFLRKEYGVGGGTFYFSEGVRGQLVYNTRGILIIKNGSYAEPDLTLPWKKVAKIIKELIDSDRYLSIREKEDIPKYLEYTENINIKAKKEKFIDSVSELHPSEKRGTLSLRLSDYVNGLEYYEKSCLEKHGLSELSATNAEQIEALLQNPQRVEELIDVLADIQGGTTSVFTRSNAWHFGMELKELYPRQHVYRLGDTVYIGSSEYEVLAFYDNMVRLFDTSFPLQNIEIPRKEFDLKLAENPANDHLIKMSKEQSPDETLSAEKENELVVPTFVQPKTNKHIQTFNLHPEIPQSDRYNFCITDDNLGHGDAKEKFHRNIEAIKTLQAIELNNRYATPEEQTILSQYVGWGGLSDAFDESKTSWTNEFMQLRTLISPDEYAAARESSLTAFYTPPIVIKTIYHTLEGMGFKYGNIVDPGCGIGNFQGLVPESMKDCKIYGVEIDSISGRIAQQLYQKNSIAIQGYEKINLPDNFFDAGIGNVPFGDFSVLDKRYDKHKFKIHDYFFAKTLDKIRPGGVIAFITSKYTMDKKSSSIRKYIAQRADLLGAIRLPDNTFKANAGTEVTADILFLQKRDRIIDIEPDWIHISEDVNGISMNSYFIDNPNMILGNMVMESTAYGYDSTCKAVPDTDLSEQLNEATQYIHAEITDYEFDDLGEEEDNSIPADPTVRNFSYTILDGQIYFRENSRMIPIEMPITTANRIKDMIAIRDCVRTLIEYQTEDYPDDDIKAEQAKLNRLYDEFIKKYGLINSRANSSAFSNDNSYCLLCSLEILDENENLQRKADMFTKRTIKPNIPFTSVDTASEALAISLAEKACVDIDFMASLMGGSEKIKTIIEDLKGVIFHNPMYTSNDETTKREFLTADEYLSGNVREKLEWAKRSAKLYPNDYTVNVEALELVQPMDLSAGEISVRLGATWLPPEIIRQFMFELLSTPKYYQWEIKVHYSKFTAQWNIEGKNHDRGNVKATNTYGTSRINAYKIIEETLNLKDVRIFDTIIDANGNKKLELNKKETTIAQQKQEAIKTAFLDWIWKDPERRNKLVRMYNDKFNCIRPREYDGIHIKFVGMNPEITLRKHQINAVARNLYGGNSLYAHVVGAGKTFTMVAASQESKRLGLCNKSLFVVPNHLTEQWSSEYLQLYPAANILVATKKDFETKNRKKFCGRIATGDFDAVIIGHSQFEKIPMSVERQRAILEAQINDILGGLAELKESKAERFSIKQLEKTKKSLQIKLEKLNDQSRKDDVVTFEELGVDRLFIDEAHYYKNLFLYTKMRNVGGIAQTEAQKSSDLFMKCRYLDELTGDKGVVFATGTPISNSMVELYTMQRYLQYKTLERNGLQHFDAWASTFGETVTAVELAPEGTHYRFKTRFAKFYNLPELMSMFREVADIQTADMLNLPVPKANYHNIAIKPSDFQKELVKELSKRADNVRNGKIDPRMDNMLKITNDGRKLALDQRLLNDMLPDVEGSKVAICADNVYEIWKNYKDDCLTQLIFCDLSTPHYDDSFNVYDDVKTKLVDKGVPDEEVVFIHDAKTESQKKELFTKVRNGQIRVLMGSTQKMGAGTNVQDKLIALHDLDCPWRPSDLEQRSGRIVRQGNKNDEVDIFRYVTEGTFDAYLYQIVENKQKFIAQIMNSKSPVRSAEDIDETALSYAEIKALATGNPYIKEKMDLDMQVAKLKVIKSSYLDSKYSLEDAILKKYPQQIKEIEERIAGYKVDIDILTQNTPIEGEKFSPMVINNITYAEKSETGQALLTVIEKKNNPAPEPIGSYRGFTMELSFDREWKITLKNKLSHTVSLGKDVFGNITRIDNVFDTLPTKLVACEEALTNIKTQMENAKIEAAKPFPQEEELKEKTARLEELNIKLNMDQKDHTLIGGEPDENEEPPEKNKDYER